MKKHNHTWIGKGARRLALMALCTVAVTGCKDEYDLDEAKPEWLGESVLQSLKDRGIFVNYLALMHDLGMDEILERTGSRTLFAAPDSAFNSFYARNAQLPETDPWHTATSYSAMSHNQKMLLAKCSMLNNAITMETLSSSDGNNPERGQYMRRNTLVSYTDSIAFLPADQLPISYNESDPDRELWDNLRQTDGVYLTDGDGTQNMMLFFTAEHMANNNMVSTDIDRVTGETRTPTDVYVYDSKIEEQDITSQNGYINLMHKVISPLPNMAEVIRTNGETNIFSHILDRFSVPIYIDRYNVGYRNLHEDFKGKIWTKWYRSPLSRSAMGSYITMNRTAGGLDIPQGPEPTDIYTLSLKDDGGEVELKYDPAWNAINTSGLGAYADMAAMFVPDDATLLVAFKNGGQLYNLIETYATPEQVAAVENASLTNLQPLYEAIDQVPMSTIQAMVNNVMRETFVGSVESKYSSLKNDAQEDLFPGGVCAVKNVKLACNGAVYVTSAIYAPADYVSVAAPAYISKDKLVVRWAIYNGSIKNETNHMAINYYAYLKAMTSRFTFFLPNDEAMKYYYDGSSFRSKRPRLIQFSYKSTSSFPITAYAFAYSDTTGEVGSRYLNESFDNGDITNRLCDLLESHTVVHEDEDDLMSDTEHKGKDQYYLTKGGTAVKVERDENGYVTKVLGGFQLSNRQKGIKASGANKGVDECNVLTSSRYVQGGNGDTYVLDAPIIPTPNSIYKILSSKDEYSRFFELCTNVDDELIDDMGMKTVYNDKGEVVAKPTTAQQSQMDKKYSIFWNDFGLDLNVAFFNSFNYTVYVPSNAAMDRAISEGLPTWEQLRQDFDLAVKDTIYKEDKATGGTIMEPTDEWVFHDKNDSLRIASQITYLFNFVRLHFQDQSVFADQTPRAANEYSTSCYYSPTGGVSDGNFLKTSVIRHGNQQMSVQALDFNGRPVGAPVNVIGEDEVTKNVMARDIVCVTGNKDTGKTPVNVTTMNKIRIGSSSSAVVHLVDDVLRLGDTYPDWNNMAQVRGILRHHKIMNKD